MPSSCDVCHSSHPAPSLGPGAYLLTPGDVGPAQLANLSAVSQSCLRCHITPTTRVRQPEFAGGAPISLSAGKYLGGDLANGHPVGRLDRLGRILGAAASRDPRRLTGSASVARFLSRGDGASVECTTCHDPHRRTGPVPSGDEQRAICADCHDPATYEYADHSTVPCSGCHALHNGGGAASALLKERDSELLCRSCHDPGRTVLSPKLSAVVGHAPTTPVGHAQNPAGASCVTCHAPHR